MFSSVFDLFRVVPRARLERATCGLEVRCSVQLSYRGVKYLQKFTSARMKEEMNVRLPSPCAQMHSYAIKADKRKSVTTQCRGVFKSGILGASKSGKCWGLSEGGW